MIIKAMEKNLKITAEQKKITEDIKVGHVQVIAVAGCGKTTTNLFLALENESKSILLLTYNTSLKMETKHKINTINIQNIEVHTYHSFAYNHYKKCMNDYGLYEICRSDVKPVKKFLYDIIILDEMQDMTFLYFEFVCKVYRDNSNEDLHFCILGDPHQTIYQYNGSDTRYFLDFPLYFNNKTWTKCVLNKTFRCTNQIADFLNSCMLEETRIITDKNNQIVRYLICDSYSDRIFREIQYYLKLGYRYSDIFILAPSVKSLNSPVRQLSNLCAENSIPVFVSYSDEEKPNEKVLSNKLVFLTFHQSKGLERKVVIIMGFDNSYFLFFKKNVSCPQTNICPNELYVAVTRSSERLTVVHDLHFDYFPFLNQQRLGETCDVEAKKLKIRKYEDYKINKYHKTVTNITKHLSFYDIYKILSLCCVTTIQPVSKSIEIQNLVAQNSTESEIYENVSDINSLCIMSIFEFTKSGKMSNLCNVSNVFSENLYEPCFISSFLQSCNQQICFSNRYFFKLYQICNYNWIKSKNLEKCIKRLNSLNISVTSKFEHEIKYELKVNDGRESNTDRTDREERQNRTDRGLNYVNTLFSGRIDCIDYENQIVWEFKCVNNLDYEHMVQVAIYQYLINKINPSNQFRFKLYNVLDNHLVLVEIKNMQEFEDAFLKIIFSEEKKKCHYDYENLKSFVQESAFGNQINK